MEYLLDTRGGVGMRDSGSLYQTLTSRVMNSSWLNPFRGVGVAPRKPAAGSQSAPLSQMSITKKELQRPIRSHHSATYGVPKRGPTRSLSPKEQM